MPIQNTVDASDVETFVFSSITRQHGLLPDHEIAKLCQGSTPMIAPFVETPTRLLNGRKVVSFGLSSAGYDIRLSDQVWLAKTVPPHSCDNPLDPKSGWEMAGNFDLMYVHTGLHGRYVIMPPLSMALGASLEYFRMPDDVMAIALGKSTYARCGIGIEITPLEVGWIGGLTIEIHNANTMPVAVYVGEGIAQLLFYRTATRPAVTYADKGGKYQNQGLGPTPSRV